MRQTRSVFITGAGGFVGRATVRRFLEEGWQVTAALRAAPPEVDLVASNLRYVEIEDISNVADWQPFLADIDVVVHLAARAHKTDEASTSNADEFERINNLATAHLAQAANVAGVKRFVFVSSAGVMGEQSRHAFTERDLPSPASEYAKSKYRAELALKDISNVGGMDLVILRPTLMYGVGNPGNLARLASLIRTGLPLPLAGATGRRSLLSVEHFANVILEASTNEIARGQTYLVSDGVDVTTADLLRAMAAAMGTRLVLFHFPTALLKLAGNLLGKRSEIDKLLGSLCVDSSLVRTQLGVQPVSTLAEISRNAAGADLPR